MPQATERADRENETKKSLLTEQRYWDVEERTFFFSSRRRHTRCSRDWSSDVCSSDLWKPKHTWETRSAASRLAAALWQGLIQDGFGKFANVVRAALKETRTTALVQRNREGHNRLVAEFNHILETYRLGLEAITPLRWLREPA